MYRIGTDITEIDRIKKSLERRGFKERVYSEAEIAMLDKRNNPYPSYAANWAAKEAFSKALGTGVVGFSLNEVEVLRDDLGKPYLRLLGNAEKCADGLSFDVSITHTSALAEAVVIAWKTNDKE